MMRGKARSHSRAKGRNIRVRDCNAVSGRAAPRLLGPFDGLPKLAAEADSNYQVLLIHGTDKMQNPARGVAAKLGDPAD